MFEFSTGEKWDFDCSFSKSESPVNDLKIVECKDNLTNEQINRWINIMDALLLNVSYVQM